MPTKRYNAEEIIHRLREADIGRQPPKPRFPAQAPDLIRGRFTGRIPGQPFLTGFQKLL